MDNAEKERADTHHRDGRIRRWSFSFCVQGLIAATERPTDQPTSVSPLLSSSFGNSVILFLPSSSFLLYLFSSLFFSFSCNSFENNASDPVRKRRTCGPSPLPSDPAGPFALSSLRRISWRHETARRLVLYLPIHLFPHFSPTDLSTRRSRDKFHNSWTFLYKTHNPIFHWRQSYASMNSRVVSALDTRHLRGPKNPESAWAKKKREK